MFERGGRYWCGRVGEEMWRYAVLVGKPKEWLLQSTIDTTSALATHHRLININTTPHHTTLLHTQRQPPTSTSSPLTKPPKHIIQIIPRSNRHSQMSQKYNTHSSHEK